VLEVRKNVFLAAKVLLQILEQGTALLRLHSTDVNLNAIGNFGFGGKRTDLNEALGIIRKRVVVRHAHELYIVECDFNRIDYSLYTVRRISIFAATGA
jgi:hypothetical protein